MGLALKQSTASQEIPLGYFVDSSDGDTAETALTIANTDIKIWKNGATTLANKNSGGATHISGGIYHATLDATDTDTVGPMVIFVHVSGALSVRLECHVFEEDIFDALYGSGAAAFDSNQRIDLGSWLGTAAATPSVGGVPEVDVTHVSGAAEDIATETKQDTIDTNVDDIETRLGTPSDFGSGTSTIAANLEDLADNGTAAYNRSTDSLQAIRDHISDGSNLTEAGGTGDHLTAIPWNASWDAEVQSEVTDALNAYDPPTNAELNTVESNIRGADSDTIKTISDQIDGLNDLSAAQVNSEVDDVLNTDAHAEPTGVPAANETLGTKIGYVFMALRNKVTVTSTKKSFYDDADNVEWEKDLSDSGSTYTETEGNAP